jgi:hypothetical protein
MAEKGETRRLDQGRRVSENVARTANASENTAVPAANQSDDPAVVLREEIWRLVDKTQTALEPVKLYAQNADDDLVTIALSNATAWMANLRVVVRQLHDKGSGHAH